MSPLVLALTAALLGAAPERASDAIFLDAHAADALIRAGATVLDARGSDAPPPYLPGARLISWTVTRRGTGAAGLLPDDLAALAATFARLGVTADRPVLVYGSMGQAWGEEGRVWWALRYLGVRRAFLLDGGLDRWRSAGLATTEKAAPPLEGAPPLKVELTPDLRADWRTVDAARRAPGTRLVDVRTEAEVEGATLYGEPRGGHIPGALHLEWHALLGRDGRLLPRAEALARLRAAGIEPGDRVITYCTGGVRSALVAAALMQYGFGRVASYDGSWLDWSSRPELPAERGAPK